LVFASLLHCIAFGTLALLLQRECAGSRCVRLQLDVRSIQHVVFSVPGTVDLSVSAPKICGTPR